MRRSSWKMTMMRRMLRWNITMKMESVNMRWMRMTIVNVSEDNDSGRRMVNMMMMMIRIMSPDITSRLNLVHLVT